MRLKIFLLVSFQLICAALFLVTSYVTKSFQSFSAQLCKSNLASLINQLDLRTSLSLNQFGSTSCRSQLQNKFQTEQLVQQQLPGNPALAIQLQHDKNNNKELDENKSLEHHQLPTNKFKQKKQNKQLQEQSASDSNRRQLHLHQLPDVDQPFTGTKQLSKKPCFTTSSFSKQKLESLNLTRSILDHDQHTQQLQHRQSEQLCADHLPANSFHRNKQQQQLIQQSFDNKMKKKQLRAFQSQLRPEPPAKAYSSMSLQQLTPSNSLESFQLPSSALLLATLVGYILVGYEHKSFQLTMQQLCLQKAQGGELCRAFPPACCTSLSLSALTLISLSFAVAWLKPFSLAWRRRRPLRNSASIPTTLTRRAAWKRSTFTTRASRRTTSSNQTCRMTALQTTSLRSTSFSTSSSTASTSLDLALRCPCDTPGAKDSAAGRRCHRRHQAYMLALSETSIANTCVHHESLKHLLSLPNALSTGVLALVSLIANSSNSEWADQAKAKVAPTKVKTLPESQNLLSWRIQNSSSSPWCPLCCPLQLCSGLRQDSRRQNGVYKSQLPHFFGLEWWPLLERTSSQTFYAPYLRLRHPQPSSPRSMRSPWGCAITIVKLYNVLLKSQERVRWAAIDRSTSHKWALEDMLSGFSKPTLKLRKCVPWSSLCSICKKGRSLTWLQGPLLSTTLKQPG